MVGTHVTYNARPPQRERTTLSGAYSYFVSCAIGVSTPHAKSKAHEHVIRPTPRSADKRERTRLDVHGWSPHRYLTRGLGQLCQLNTDQLLAWPTCKTHYELTTGFHSFYDWVWNSMQTPHAPLHLWLGGTMDCAGTYETIGELVGNPIAETLTILVIYHRRGMFCDNVWYCDGRADVETKPPEVCIYDRCVCVCRRARPRF